jgi:phage terminase large subunit
LIDHNSSLTKFLQGYRAIYNEDDCGNHIHDLDEMEYIAAVYRSKMFFAAEDDLEETYENLHEAVLKAMGYAFVVFKIAAYLFCFDISFA